MDDIDAESDGVSVGEIDGESAGGLWATSLGNLTGVSGRNTR